MARVVSCGSHVLTSVVNICGSRVLALLGFGCSRFDPLVVTAVWLLVYNFFRLMCWSSGRVRLCVFSRDRRVSVLSLLAHPLQLQLPSGRVRF